MVLIAAQLVVSERWDWQKADTLCLYNREIIYHTSMERRKSAHHLLIMSFCGLLLTQTFAYLCLYGFADKLCLKRSDYETL